MFLGYVKRQVQVPQRIILNKGTQFNWEAMPDLKCHRTDLAAMMEPPVHLLYMNLVLNFGFREIPHRDPTFMSFLVSHNFY